MASSSKKKTTMAKLNRETAVRERRLRKQAKKDARKQAAADGLTAPAEPRPEDEGPLGTAEESPVGVEDEAREEAPAA
jgi:hypothetical protein